MTARVVSNGTGTNTWAKGGVMIRDSLNGGSTQAMMAITGSGGNGASFQYRAATNGASANIDSGAVLAPPYWVKMERIGRHPHGLRLGRRQDLESAGLDDHRDGGPRLHRSVP